jgi:hypothetical protein
LVLVDGEVGKGRRDVDVGLAERGVERSSVSIVIRSVRNEVEQSAMGVGHSELIFVSCPFPQVESILTFLWFSEFRLKLFMFII